MIIHIMFYYIKIYFYDIYLLYNQYKLMMKDCIKDIELSIKLNYPKQLHYKLYLRAIQCYLKLGKHHLAKETLSKIQKLIHDPNYIKPSIRGK